MYSSSQMEIELDSYSMSEPDEKIQDIVTHNFLTRLFPELLMIIFSQGHIKEFKGLLLTSKLCHDLFWSYQVNYKFVNSNFTECHLENLLARGDIRGLKRIELVGTNVTNLSALSNYRLFGLETLIIHDLVEKKLSLAGLICTFPNLIELNLINVEIRSGISELVELTRLTSLQIIGGITNLKDNDISFLSKLTRLVTLTLPINHQSFLSRDGGEGISVTKSSLDKLIEELGDSNLGVLANLKTLTHFDTGMFLAPTYKNLIPLIHSPLIRLCIRQGQLIDDAGLNQICQMTQLRDLRIAKLHFATNWFSLVKLSNIVNLGLSKSRIDNEGLTHLADMKSLRRLDISGSGKITDSGVNNFLSLTRDRRIELILLDDCNLLRRYLAFSMYRSVLSDGQFDEWKMNESAF